MSEKPDDRSVNRALRNITKGAGLVLTGTFLQLGLAFLGNALMARELEVAQYGSISLGILVINVGATFALLGLDTGVARFIPRYDDTKQRISVIASACQIALPASLLVGVLTYVSAPTISVFAFRDSSVTPIIRVMAAGIPFWC